MFIEERLLECVAYGTRGGPTWLTRKVALKNGVIRRNAQRSRPLYRFDVIYRNLLPESHHPVINAFNACRGGLDSFRLKDPADYIAEDQVLSALGTGAPQTLQLRKGYTFGGQTIWRPIRKPVAGTVEITANNAPLAATVDTTTGEVTFTATLGHTIRASFEFDVPVMFEDDALQFSIDDRSMASDTTVAPQYFLTTDIPLVEDIAA